MLKPQDIVVALRLQLHPERKWRIVDLAGVLRLSSSEVHGALERLQKAGLLDAESRRVRAHAFRDLLFHGVRAVYYPEWAPRGRGTPTAWSAPPLVELLATDPRGAVVWPDLEGESIGEGLLPLYRTVPAAARADPELHAVLALVDGLRIGGTREIRLATEALNKCLF